MSHHMQHPHQGQASQIPPHPYPAFLQPAFGRPLVHSATGNVAGPAPTIPTNPHIPSNGSILPPSSLATQYGTGETNDQLNSPLSTIPLPFHGHGQYSQPVRGLVPGDVSSSVSSSQSQSCIAPQGSGPSSLQAPGMATPLMDDMESGGHIPGSGHQSQQRIFPLHQHLVVSSAQHSHQRSASSDQLTSMVKGQMPLQSHHLPTPSSLQGATHLVEPNPVRHFSNPSSVREVAVDNSNTSSLPAILTTENDATTSYPENGLGTTPPLPRNTNVFSQSWNVSHSAGHYNNFPPVATNGTSVSAHVTSPTGTVPTNGSTQHVAPPTYPHDNHGQPGWPPAAAAPRPTGNPPMPFPPPIQRPGPQLLSRPPPPEVVNPGGGVAPLRQPYPAYSAPPQQPGGPPPSTFPSGAPRPPLLQAGNANPPAATLPPVSNKPPSSSQAMLPPQPSQSLPVVDVPEHARVVNLLQINNALATENVLSGLTSKTPLHQDLPTPSLTQHMPNKPNCEPAVMSCTLNAIPSTSQLLQQSRLPLGLVLHPFRDLANLPVIQASTIVRCRKCRTYIHPFVGMNDQGGRRWKCSVCFHVNDLPDEFYYDPISKRYGEPQRRPELRSATVEFIAPNEYTLRPPQAAVYLFVLEVSRVAVSSGYLQVVCREISRHLDSMPGDEKMQIGFITYASGIEFFKLNGASPRVCVCPDLEEVFLPEPNGLIVKREDFRTNIADLLDNLPTMYEHSLHDDNCLGSALKAALKLVGPTGGRITIFNHTLPNTGLGKLANRLAQSQDKRESLFQPSTDYYKAFALECASQQVGIDIFSLGPLYQDLSTLSGACRFSAGGLYRYSNLSATSGQFTSRAMGSDCVSELDRSRLRQDFARYLTRKIGFEAVLRLRCTRGLSITAFHGNCFVRSTDLLSLPNVSPDVGFAIQLAIDDSLEQLALATFQVALLYTSSQGERRIRVHTLCAPLTSNASEVQQHANHYAIASLLSKMAVERVVGCGGGDGGSISGSSSLLNAREALVHAVVDPLHAFAKREHRSAGANQLYVPFHLRHLPRLVMGLLKCDALLPSGHVASVGSVDDQLYALECLRNFPLTRLLTYIYPSLFALQWLPTTFPDTLILSSTDNDDSDAKRKPRDKLTKTPQLLENNSEEEENDEDEEGEICDNVAALNLKDSNGVRRSVNISKLDAEMDKWLASGEAKSLNVYRLPLSAAHLSRDGVFLMDCGEYLLIVLSRECSPVFVQQLSRTLQSENVSEDGLMSLLERVGLLSSPGTNLLPRIAEPVNVYVRCLLRWLQLHRRMGSALAVMRDTSPLRNTLLLRRLVEDRGLVTSNISTGGDLRRLSSEGIQLSAASCSYIEFLQMICQAVQARK